MDLCCLGYSHATCRRCILMTLNFPHFMVGILALGVFGYAEGLLSEVDEKQLSHDDQKALKTINSVFIFAVAVGVAIVFSGFLGCFGSCCNSRIIIILYIASLLIVILLEISAVSALFIIRGKLQNTLQSAEIRLFCGFCVKFLMKESGTLNIVGYVLIGAVFLQVIMVIVATYFSRSLRGPRERANEPSGERMMTQSIPTAPSPIQIPNSSSDHGKIFFNFLSYFLSYNSWHASVTDKG